MPSDGLLISARRARAYRCAEAISSALIRPRDPDHRLQALLFDSWFDAYRGVIVLSASSKHVAKRAEDSPKVECRVFDVDALGVLTPSLSKSRARAAKSIPHRQHQTVADTKIGETIVDERIPPSSRCPD